jgi:hypothetical protein
VEKIVESLTVESDSGSRPMRQSEFEDAVERGDPGVIKTRDRVTKLFGGASHESTPGLWRVLLTEATLMQTFTEMVAGDASRSDSEAEASAKSIPKLMPPTFAPSDSSRYAWPDDGTALGAESQTEAVKNYLATRFSNIDDVFLKRVIPVESET